MGYNKIVVSGNQLELYEYEKNINMERGIGRIARARKAPVALLDMDEDRKNALEETKLGKRRDNAKRAELAFRRLVLCNLGEPPYPLLFTFTYRENIQGLQQGYKDFKAFIRFCRSIFGKRFKYLCVPEFQKRGAVHFHALIWNLSKPDGSLYREGHRRVLAFPWRQIEGLLDERLKGYFKNVSPTFSKIWGKGFVFLKQTDGNERLSTYLSKYMSKAFVDKRLFSQKAYVSSRNVLRPTVIGGIDRFDIVLDDYGLSTAYPLRTSEFMTQWLGKGRYSQYNIN